MKFYQLFLPILLFLTACSPSDAFNVNEDGEEAHLVGVVQNIDVEASVITVENVETNHIDLDALLFPNDPLSLSVNDIDQSTLEQLKIGQHVAGWIYSGIDDQEPIIPVLKELKLEK